MAPTMAPWDTLQYFDPVKETLFSNPAAAQVAIANSMRVALIFSAGGTGTYGITVTTKRPAAAHQGIALTNATGYVVLTAAEFGPLVTLDWYATVLAGTCDLTVIEVNLARWPEPRRQSARRTPGRTT